MIGFLGAGQRGHLELVRQRAGRRLVAHVFQQLRRGADEDDALARAGAGERGVFREEPVARVDHRDALLLGERDDALDVEVGADRAFRRVERIGLVRLEAVDGEAVLLGEDRDRAQAEFVGGAEDADGDFAAVGGHQFSGAGGRVGHVQTLCLAARGWRVKNNGCGSFPELERVHPTKRHRGRVGGFGRV